MYRVEITNNINDLEQELWSFIFLDRKMLTVDHFSHLARKSKRHGWKTDTQYNRINQRDNTLGDGQVPLTEPIKQQALAKFIEDITVTMERTTKG